MSRNELGKHEGQREKNTSVEKKKIVWEEMNAWLI